MSVAPTWTEFRALGTYVHLQTTGDLDQAHRRAAEILDEVDLACSRFRQDSDLSRLNRAGGSWTEVSPFLIAALRVAVAAAEQTDGIVDPCLGRSLIELGYDRDFDQVRRREDVRVLRPISVKTGRWSAIEFEQGAVRIPRDISLDLGATAKAWASDLVARSLAVESGHPVLVSLGGDISIAGQVADSAPWPIDVTEHPDGLDEEVQISRIWLDAGGLATSSSEVRRWRAGGRVRHHVLDPRTGMPTAGPWRTVTATGASCVAANTASTAALVLGEGAVSWLEERAVSARLVALDGSVTRVGSWPEPLPGGES